MDQLRVTSENNRSLEDHSRQLSKTIGQMTSMIATAKGAGAATFAKIMPTATSPMREGPSSSAAASHPSGSSAAKLSSTGASFSATAGQGNSGSGGTAGIEKKFSGLKASLVEKSSSKDTQL